MQPMSSSPHDSFPTHISKIQDIQHQYDAFIIDVWGVLHNGHQVFPGVLETLEMLASNGKQVSLLSNSPRRQHILAQDLMRFGITSSHYSFIHTSGEDAYEAISGQRGFFSAPMSSHCYVISSKAHDGLVQDCGLCHTDDFEKASFIFNTGPESGHSIDFSQVLATAKSFNLPMICVNPDLAVFLGDQLYQCAGSLAQSYEQMGGKVHYHGKPFPSVYQSVLERFGPNKKVLAIGDSLRTDIAGASAMGLDSMLVQSGMDQSVPDSSPVKPTYLSRGLGF